MATTVIEVDDHQAKYLNRLRSRDPDLLAEIVGQHSRALLRAAWGLGFRGPEAEDLVQDIFTTFLKSLERFEGRSQVRTWLFGILYRKAMELRRNLGREAETESLDQVFESRFSTDGLWLRAPADGMRSTESHEMGQAIRCCLEELAVPQRSAFLLREVEDLKSEEICKILDVTPTNLGVLLFRARTRLRECLEARGWSRNK